MFQLGLVSVSFREKSVQEIVTAAKNAGLEWIEWGSDIHVPKDDAERVEEVVTLQKEAGIRCSSYGTYFTMGDDDLSELNGYFAVAKKLGTNIIRFWCGSKSSAEYPPADLEELYGVCRKAAKMAEMEDVILCAECHGGTLTDTRESALALMKAINSPSFRMYWQPNQYQCIDENIKNAQLLDPYVTHIHTFQWKREERFPLENGIQEWIGYLEHFEGDHMLLLEFMPDDRIESLPGEAASLRKIVQLMEAGK